MDIIEIQVQDSTGNWRTHTMTQNSSILIIDAMKALKWQFPELRGRSIDGNERLVDLIG